MLQHSTAIVLSLLTSLMLGACERSPAARQGQASAAEAGVPPPVKIWSKFDDFQSDLASRTRQQIGGNDADSDDYQIIVTILDAPIGTLFRSDRFVPVGACTPPTSIFKADAPNLFPGRYRMSREVAVGAGLEKVPGGLATLDAQAAVSDAFDFSISDASIEELDDDSLKKMLTSKDCLAVVAGRTLRLIRGRILGERSFSVASSATAAFGASVAGVGAVHASGGVPQNSLGLSDGTPQSFLQVISVVSVAAPAEIKVTAAAAATAAHPGVPPKAVQAPVSVTVASAPATATLQRAGEIYIQMDKTDPVDGRAITKELQQLGNVASAIERIAPSHMPSHTQVRYFHDQDRSKAGEISADLRAHGYPDSNPVRIGLAAPAGQFEVWLTKPPTP